MFMFTDCFVVPFIIFPIFPSIGVLSSNFTWMSGLFTLPFVLLSDVTLFPVNKFKLLSGCGIILGCGLNVSGLICYYLK